MINGPDDYSEDSFWKKLLKYAKIAGKEVVEKALWLYYAAQKEETPARKKLISVLFLQPAFYKIPIQNMHKEKPFNYLQFQ